MMISTKKITLVDSKFQCIKLNFFQLTVSQPNLRSPDTTPNNVVEDVTMSPMHSVPSGLQKSTETLNSITDAGSIGEALQDKYIQCDNPEN